LATHFALRQFFGFLELRRSTTAAGNVVVLHRLKRVRQPDLSALDPLARQNADLSLIGFITLLTH
jgi:hypothetical protein